MKTELRKRIESFAWRAGMMMLAAAIDYALSHSSQLMIPAEFTVVFGLILGEVSKVIKGEIDFRNEVKEITEL